jgi:hypothetical protein
LDASFHPTPIAAILFGVALLVESWFSWRFLRQLRRDYPDLWERSGCRTIWTDTDLISAWPTIQFLWYREYEDGASPEEIRFCEKYRLPVTLSWAAAGVTVAAALLLIFTVGWPKS